MKHLTVTTVLMKIKLCAMLVSRGGCWGTQAIADMSVIAVDTVLIVRGIQGKMMVQLPKDWQGAESVRLT